MRRRLRARLWRSRWLLATICVGLAAWLVVVELRPPPAATTPVVVAAHDLAAGTVLTAADLRTVALAEAPSSTLALDDVVGSTLTVGVPEGLPVVTTMLLGPGLLDAAPAGWVVVPVPLADANLAALVRVGDRVDLYLAAADTGGRLDDAVLVTSGALVLARETTAEGSTGWLAGAQSQQATVLVVAIRPQDAAGLTGAAGLGPFRAVLASR